MTTRLRCCVIGGAGFIGTHLVRLLVNAGRDVIVVGRRSKAPAALPERAVYVSGDYNDKSVLQHILSGVSEVVDLAYATAPQTSFADPIFDIVANLPPSVGLLQAAVAAKVQKILLVSSGGTVYGPARSLPITEDHPVKPISPYGITKLAIENYGWMYRSLFDLPVVVVRPGNAYGEGQRTLSGQGFIAAAIHSTLQGKVVDIYGEKGTVRDYIHVSDIAAGIVAALDKGEAGNAYNIGTGQGRSNMEVVETIKPLAAAAGLSVKTRHLPARGFDVSANYLDSGRLHAVSGWRPKVTLPQGIATLWRAMSARN